MSDDKKFPAASQDIAGLLNMDKSGEPAAEVPDTAQPPADLPFATGPAEAPVKPSEEPDNIADVLGTPQPKGQEEEPVKRPDFLSVVKTLSRSFVPYLVVFVVGVVLYFAFFSNFNITGVVNTSKLKIDQLTKETANQELSSLQKSLEKEYQNWIDQFFFAVNDPEITSMDADVSGNGLTNFEKFLFNLNPKVYSTRGEFSDGEMLLKGLNPWTAKPLTKEQQDTVDKFINKELISNRIAAASIQSEPSKFSAYVSQDSPYYSATPPVTPPTTPPVTPPSTPPKSTQSTAPGLLEIPSLGISVPLIWSQKVSAIEADLKKGVVRYPGTAMPGENGLTYISGHSSGYIWDKSPYKQIFASLGSLVTGAEFTISVPKSDGGFTKYTYVVEERGEYQANDQLQFAGTGGSQVALSTCWPVGSTEKRLVIVGKLSKTE